MIFFAYAAANQASAARSMEVDQASAIFNSVLGLTAVLSVLAVAKGKGARPLVAAIAIVNAFVCFAASAMATMTVTGVWL